jgi:hypothetical protein
VFREAVYGNGQFLTSIPKFYFTNAFIDFHELIINIQIVRSCRSILPHKFYSIFLLRLLPYEQVSEFNKSIQIPELNFVFEHILVTRLMLDLKIFFQR